VRRRTYPVHDVVVVEEGHSLKQHHHVPFDLGLCQRSLGVPDDLREI
jgi:hypothetical protein